MTVVENIEIVHLNVDAFREYPCVQLAEGAGQSQPAFGCDACCRGNFAQHRQVEIGTIDREANGLSGPEPAADKHLQIRQFNQQQAGVFDVDAAVVDAEARLQADADPPRRPYRVFEIDRYVSTDAEIISCLNSL